MRELRSPLVLSGALLLATFAASQRINGQAPAATALIMGRVVDAESGQPLSGVVISMSAIFLPNPTTAPAGTPRRVLTDAQGRFVFRQLGPGSYTIAATVGGSGFSPSGFIIYGSGSQIGAYLNGGYGQRRPNGPMQRLDLAEGERVSDVLVRLWKGGAIDGLVLDEAGEPMVGTVVAAARRSSDGRLLSGPSTSTDDSGAYHLSTLVPGEYVVVVPQIQVLMPSTTIDTMLASPAAPSLSGALTSTGAPIPSSNGVSVGSVVSAMRPPMAANVAAPVQRDGKLHVYQSTFHPSATVASRARPITVKSGDEHTGINVSLVPMPANEVSGTMTDGAGPVPNFGVWLMPADEGDCASVLEVAQTATDALGRFAFPLVPAGQYRLVARRTSPVPPPSPIPQPATAAAPAPPAVRTMTVADGVGAWAMQSVSVGDEPLRDITLLLRPGVQARGRLDYVGTTPRPVAAAATFQVILVSAQPLSRSGVFSIEPSARGEGDEFVVRGIAPGRYVVRITGPAPPWSLESMVINGRDLAGGVLTVSVDDIPDMVVTYTDRPAELSGTVTGANGAPDVDASVVIFPADRGRWPDGRAATRAFRIERTTKTGAFRFATVIPDEYLVVAVTDDVLDDWPDARLLAKLANVATRVQFSNGQKQTVALKTTEVR